MTVTLDVPTPDAASRRPFVVPIHRLGQPHEQAQACAACDVRRLALFGALDEAGLARIHAPLQPVAFAPDERLFGIGESASAVFTIRSGVVRFERFTQGGDRRIVRLAGRGDLIGQEALLRRRYEAQAVACTAVQLCRIPTTLIDELGERSAQLPRELMSRWQGALDDAQSWVADLSTGPARRRMLKLLHRLCGHADGCASVWMPRREEMSAMLDITVETASRIVSSLRREGVLLLTAPRSARIDSTALVRALDEADRL